MQADVTRRQALALIAAAPADEDWPPYRFTVVWHETLTADEVATIHEWCRRTNRRGALIQGGPPWIMEADEWGHLSLVTHNWHSFYFSVAEMLAHVWNDRHHGGRMRFSVSATPPRDPELQAKPR